MAHLRRTLAAIFAGERRVWALAALASLPLLALLGYYLLQPREYLTGTDSAEVISYPVVPPAGTALCIPGLEIPPGTRQLRLQARTPSGGELPALELALHIGSRTIPSALAPAAVGAGGVGGPSFALPALGGRALAATACVSAAGPIAWGGTVLSSLPTPAPAIGATPLPVKFAVWYLPGRGSRSSYLARAGTILARASLFRPSPFGPWLYWLALLGALPLAALAALRCLALAAAGRAPRRTGLWLFAIAAVNFACWSLITPAFQAPDEVDHFAYTQSLVERGQAPQTSPSSALLRWSDSEGLLLSALSFPTDHQAGDSRPPWLALEERDYRAIASRTHPPSNDGGGYETAATHGPLYYAALAPAYLLASASPLSQLQLMRLVSALIGALTVLFAYLLVRELAPRRQWPAVLTALLVAFQPMYGFMSGTVNNDVGVNAGAAALELLMIRLLRRGLTLRSGALIGLLAVLLPLVKGTILSLYPLLALTLAVVLWRDHRPRALRPWGLAVVGAGVGAGIAAIAGAVWKPSAAASAAGGGGSIGNDTGSVGEALHHLPDYASYVWQVFLPRLSFMTRHFPPGELPAYVIYVKRGWAAFGWYDVLYPGWVYALLAALMLLVIPLALLAARRERVWLAANRMPVAVLLLAPVLVMLGVEAAFYTPGVRPALAEFGRYEFPAIVPLAALLVGTLHVLGRRRALAAGAVLLTAMIAFSVGSQMLTLTSFYG